MADNNKITLMTEEKNSDGVIIVKAPDYNRIRISRWRVREGFPVSSNQVILLYEILPMEGDIQHANNKLLHKFKVPRMGVVKKRLYADGAIVSGGVPLLELSECVHTTVIKDMCADCGADLRQNENGKSYEASVPMVHAIPDLKVTQKLAQKLGRDDTIRLLKDRKLVLLVDLDQTIIHTTNDNVPNNIRGIYHFQLYGPQSPWYHTRLRPGTVEFLQRTSEQYELHICTFGARNYAHMIAQILDPNGRFFSHRILSRDECFNATSKTDNLKALFPNGDSMVCIIDDREDVWNMASNLIQVKPYHFFQHTGDINAPPGLSKHELDGEGVDFKDINSSGDGGGNNSTVRLDDNKDKKAIEILEDNKEKEKNINNVEVNAERSSSSSNFNSNELLDIVDVTMIDGQTSNQLENNNESNNVLISNGTNINDKEEEKKDEKEKKEVERVIEEETVTVKTEGECKINDNTATDLKISTASSVDCIEENIPSKMKLCVPKQVEINDPDDYLMYLKDILDRIHKRFYNIYDETNEIPDLKIIVPKIRSEVLRDCNLVFSGLVPTNMKLQQSRAYFIAKSLGATVTQNITEDTTHLVAVTTGTYKVNAAKKNSRIKIVNPNWLWTSSERWEHVEEKLYPLERKMKEKERQPPAHCHSPEHVVNYNEKSEITAESSMPYSSDHIKAEKFMDTINPLLSFSHADLADMNKEFEQFFDSDTSSEDDHTNIENPPINKVLRKRKRQENEEERTRKFFTRTSNSLQPNSDIIIAGKRISSKRGEGCENTKSSSEENTNDSDDETDVDEDEDDDDDDDMPSEKFRRGENLPSDLEMDSDSNNNNNSSNNNSDEDDGEWNMMGAALEREFLGLEE